MIKLSDLVAYTNDYLEVGRFQDYAPNGLQVEGRRDVSNIVSGVTASLALLDAAIAAGADVVLVHHGYFWRGEDARVVGMKRERLRRLLVNDISLLAYHLPLDAHPQCGNNAQLANVLGFRVEGSFGPGANPLGCFGRLAEPVNASELVARCAARLGSQPLHIAAGARAIERVAWCSGAAQDYLEDAAAIGADVYVSGEVSERTVHVARELGVDYIAAGHHATERYGVQALGEHLAARFGLRHEFIDIPNPV